MIVQAFVSDLLGATAYLIADEQAKEAVVVDAPHAITDELVAVAQRYGLHIRYIINTHGHFDHVADNVALKTASGAQIAANVGDADRLAKPESVMFQLPFTIEPSSIDYPLAEGMEISVGDISLRILHTPGHTPGSICIYDEQHAMLWTGDTLFAGTYGRTDLRGGDEEQMFATLSRLAALPPATRVFPGHGDDTTIAAERWLQRVSMLAKFNRLRILAKGRTPDMENTLYYGDNLDVLRRHIKDESIDLIYLDPPFNSKKDYNVLYAEQDGSRSAAQIKAFRDTWQWDVSSARAYQEVVEAGGKVSQAMQGFRALLGDTDTLAYLAMMAPRLVELRRVLKETGSIYLHCDPTASHYLKQLMDAVFGAKNFRNEIIWHYRKWANKTSAFQRNHDVLLFYSRSLSHERTFNQLYMARAASTQRRFGNAKIVSAYDEAGRRVPSRTENEESPGVGMDDVWDIPRVPPVKQLFPTQKPLALLRRIIEASSNEGDVVLDPFCGCGTAVVAAEELQRNWIGIDITQLAITLIKHRLANTNYRVVGEPVSFSEAQVLAQQDPYQFQFWALGLVGARPVEEKKGADKGIDGRLYFHDESPDGATVGKTKQIIISVKAGKLQADYVRALLGVVERERAEMGVLLTMNEPTSGMRADAASAGFYDSTWGGRHPRLQIITVAELLNGTRIDYPAPRQVNVTFRRADDDRVAPGKQGDLPLDV